MHMPGLKQKPFQEDEVLLPITQLPMWAQNTFTGCKNLNRIQSRLHKTALNSDQNLLLCAPTVGCVIDKDFESCVSSGDITLVF